jgi:SAM-dependent methyltransferase
MSAASSPKYFHEEETHNLRAPRRIVPFIIDTFQPTSVVDVGCGTGTFLSVFRELGVPETLGIDGAWVDREKLHIPEDTFLEADLEAPIRLDRRFDLAVCVEVAEHLAPEAADRFVKDLCSLSDIIVFSAALPGQGGQNHVNEQPFEYWQEKFAVNDRYFYDLFRPKFWDDDEVDWWYRQNMFLIARSGAPLPEVVSLSKIDGKARSCYHPELYRALHAKCDLLEQRANELRSPTGFIKSGLKYFGRKIAGRSA